MPALTERPETYLVPVWNEQARSRIERVFAANPKATAAHLAAAFKCPVSAMRRFLEENQEAMDVVELGRAVGDNAISQKNFALALQGDRHALDREMKKRGMLGNDNGPVMPREQGRDYSKLTVDELEFLAKIDDKTRNRPPTQGVVREIAAPLHS